EHKKALERLGMEAKEVRKREHLEGVKALIIPGGESTTIGKLAREYGIEEEVRRRVEEGSLALFGTCAGAIWLAREILGYPEQPRLGVLNVAVERNAFGRQVESFEEDLEVQGLGPFHGVFIRAPVFRRLGEGVEVLAQLEGLPVLVRQGKILASAFHPELTQDPRLHGYFLELAGL
ncbi:MAG: pyridoxal 5'-phosphate synthase glutaminase subunit PdxT, partial [Thermus sp.]|nr:pyridoxal 5'-phosphate synthase glutaminase subunit PdxT [Thermus sp.]